MKLAGYWFCEGKCDDTVILPLPRRRAKPGLAECPQCHQITARWKPGVPEGVFRADVAAGASEPARIATTVHRWRADDHGRFDAMRRLVAAAPDLQPLAK